MLQVDAVNLPVRIWVIIYLKWKGRSSSQSYSCSKVWRCDACDTITVCCPSFIMDFSLKSCVWTLWSQVGVVCAKNIKISQTKLVFMFWPCLTPAEGIIHFIIHDPKCGIFWIYIFEVTQPCPRSGLGSFLILWWC